MYDIPIYIYIYIYVFLGLEYVKICIFHAYDIKCSHKIIGKIICVLIKKIGKYSISVLCKTMYKYILFCTEQSKST